MKNIKLTQAFRNSVDSRLDDVKALEGVTYTNLAKGVLTATRVGSFFAPKYQKTVQYAEVTLNGALYGVGFVVEGNNVVVLNVLTAGMVKYNRRAAHVTVKTVAPVGA